MNKPTAAHSLPYRLVALLQSLSLMSLVISGCSSISASQEEAVSKGNPTCTVTLISNAPEAVLFTKSGKPVGKLPAAVRITEDFTAGSGFRYWSPHGEMAELVNDGNWLGNKLSIYFVGKVIAEGYYDQPIRVAINSKGVKLPSSKRIQVAMVPLPYSGPRTAVQPVSTPAPQQQQQQQTVVVGASERGQPDSGSIAILCDSQEAEVYVDAGYVGNPPANLKLPVGIHVIEVKYGGKVFRKEVRVFTDCSLTIRAVLE
jgi:hypothetical protein